ncbi:MAG: hypothetical protein ING68_01890 [Rhodocyclaceae bacterium]|jgi:hypothetical protein|nr:hypothetical protein [Rhodocyclaceae bacterium]MCA3020898.1 hypothetical protein [Rhodocyclaceae bacterium]
MLPMLAIAPIGHSLKPMMLASDAVDAAPRTTGLIRIIGVGAPTVNYGKAKWRSKGGHSGVLV